MLYLIIGGSKAGKSRYAEQLAVTQRAERMLYFATMVPVGDGEAGTACIERHRAQRRGLGFETIEKAVYLREIPLQPSDVVLLEDVPNLIGNYQFGEKKADALAEALQDIREIAGRCKALIAVTYAEMPMEPSFDEETKGYVEKINEMARLLAEEADSVVMLEQGKSKTLKVKVPLQ